MLILTLLVVQFLISAALGWFLGVRKGVAVSALIFLGFAVIALIYSGLWIFYIIFLLPVHLIVSGLGATSGEQLRGGNKRTAVIFISLCAISFVGIEATQIANKSESNLVVEFVRQNKEVMLLAGERIKVHSPGRIWTGRISPYPTKYEVYANGARSPKGFYARVDATRSWWGGTPTFSLSCVYFVQAGNYDLRVKECKY